MDAKTILEENVAKGAELLDCENPNWYLSIDVAKLDLMDCDRCVLGQLYDFAVDELGYTHGYYAGKELLDINEPSNYGFSMPLFNTERSYISGELWRMLRETWIGAIKERCNR